ncbi:MAG TPA: hypothetical protein VKV18_04470 [Chthonomonas sp.]|jgi:hypothetical protein|uniref:hypothetical protein n=1 Tax=Chthonomonas sp. TaxID=2282153 RepID=UPI002B4ADF18|nr:hypothetical protein [Chthonomonas sp.]HLH79287.1 hypothetical protein [Chthonomonas sp.]HLI47930.1 hypothetical protein [Chthonomonas sp.]
MQREVHPAVIAVVVAVVVVILAVIGYKVFGPTKQNVSPAEFMKMKAHMVPPPK